MNVPFSLKVSCLFFITASPDDDVAVGVASDDVAVVVEGHAGDVLGLVAFKETIALGKRAVRLERPEGAVVLADGDDDVLVDRVELAAQDPVSRTLPKKINNKYITK